MEERKNMGRWGKSLRENIRELQAKAGAGIL
jgi:hypothetical protein